MSLIHGHEQWGGPVRRSHVDIGSGVNQRIDQQRETLGRGVHQRCPTPVVARVCVRARSQSRVNTVDVACLHQPMQNARRRRGLEGGPVGRLKRAARRRGGLRHPGAACGNGAHDVQRLTRQLLGYRQSFIAQEGLVSLHRPIAPPAVSHSGVVAQRGQQRLRLPDCLEQRTARIVCGERRYSDLRPVGSGAAAGAPRQRPFLSRCNLVRAHFRGQSIALGQRLHLSPARGQVEPHVGQDVVLRHSEAGRVEPRQRHHGARVAVVGRNLPHCQRLGGPPCIPRALPGQVVRLCRRRRCDRDDQRQGQPPDMTSRPLFHATSSCCHGQTPEVPSPRSIATSTDVSPALPALDGRPSCFPLWSVWLSSVPIPFGFVARPTSCGCFPGTVLSSKSLL